MERDIKFEYGFESVNGIVKKVYFLSEIPFIQSKCDLWNNLPITYVRQYTGLKDKNGVEIYEGDIVEAMYKNKEEYFIGKVVMPKSCWCLSEKYDNGYTVYRRTSNFNQFEVIGNIYQNKNLIKTS